MSGLRVKSGVVLGDRPVVLAISLVGLSGVTRVEILEEAVEALSTIMPCQPVS